MVSWFLCLLSVSIFVLALFNQHAITEVLLAGHFLVNKDAILLYKEPRRLPLLIEVLVVPLTVM